MTAYELILVVADIGDLGDSRVDAAEAELDVVFERHDALCLATMTVDGASAYHAAVEGVVRLRELGFTLLRSYPDLVNRGEMAERLGVTRQAVGNWIRGERLSSVVFPAPMHLAAGGLWLWGDVVDWYRVSGYVDEDAGLRYPSMADHVAIDAHIYESEHGILLSRK